MQNDECRMQNEIDYVYYLREFRTIAVRTRTNSSASAINSFIRLAAIIFESDMSLNQ